MRQVLRHVARQSFLAAATAATVLAAPRPAPAPPKSFPFAVGETLRYEARVGAFAIGGATATVSRTERVRGIESFVLTAAAQGGPPGFGARYDLTSWTGVSPFVSYRFHRRAEQAGRVDEHHFEIVPDSGRYREVGSGQDFLTATEPLDELAFLYWLRTVPLAVGSSASYPRYFRPGFNPIKVAVTGREMVTLVDGTTIPCLALTVSAAAGASQVWLSDDARRLPTMLRLQLPYGQVTFRLQAAPARTAAPQGTTGAR